MPSPRLCAAGGEWDGDTKKWVGRPRSRSSEGAAGEVAHPTWVYTRAGSPGGCCGASRLRGVRGSGRRLRQSQEDRSVALGTGDTRFGRIYREGASTWNSGQQVGFAQQ